MKPFLTLEHISKTYPGVKALEEVRIDFVPGEVHALVGENGAGKSTLIKILAGVIDPDPGAIIMLDGKPVRFEHPTDANRHGISVNYQDLSLFSNLSVAENISIGQKSAAGWRHMPWREVRRRAREALDRLGIDMDIHTPVERLPIARQQLVAIARAIAFDARLIVLDEPTSSLSASEVELLFRILDDLKRQKVAVLFVSHKLDELFRVADRFTVLRDGKYVGCYPKSELDEKTLISLMVGRTVVYERQQLAEYEADAPVLEARHLTKNNHFRDISFQLHRGEILALTGLVGSGRTELAQALFGVHRFDDGELLLNGKPVRWTSTRDAVDHGIGYVPESRQTQGLVLNQTVERNITLAVLKKMTAGWLLKRSKETDLAREYVERLDIRPGIPKMQAAQLSGGNQQKVVVAKWLAAAPQVLIVDEPTNGIDIGAKTEMHRLLSQLAKEGMAILMISSELPEVLSVSHRVLVMRRGRIVADMKTIEATQEMILDKALSGLPGEMTKTGADEGVRS